MDVHAGSVRRKQDAVPDAMTTARTDTFHGGRNWTSETRQNGNITKATTP